MLPQALLWLLYVLYYPIVSERYLLRPWLNTSLLWRKKTRLGIDVNILQQYPEEPPFYPRPKPCFLLVHVEDNPLQSGECCLA